MASDNPTEGGDRPDHLYPNEVVFAVAIEDDKDHRNFQIGLEGRVVITDLFGESYDWSRGGALQNQALMLKIASMLNRSDDYPDHRVHIHPDDPRRLVLTPLPGRPTAAPESTEAPTDSVDEGRGAVRSRAIRTLEAPEHEELRQTFGAKIERPLDNYGRIGFFEGGGSLETTLEGENYRLHDGEVQVQFEVPERPGWQELTGDEKRDTLAMLNTAHPLGLDEDPADPRIITVGGEVYSVAGDEVYRQYTIPASHEWREEKDPMVLQRMAVDLTARIPEGSPYHVVSRRPAGEADYALALELRPDASETDQPLTMIPLREFDLPSTEGSLAVKPEFEEDDLEGLGHDPSYDPDTGAGRMPDGRRFIIRMNPDGRKDAGVFMLKPLAPPSTELSEWGPYPAELDEITHVLERLRLANNLEKPFFDAALRCIEGSRQESAVREREAQVRDLGLVDVMRKAKEKAEREGTSVEDAVRTALVKTLRQKGPRLRPEAMDEMIESTQQAYEKSEELKALAAAKKKADKRARMRPIIEELNLDDWVLVADRANMSVDDYKANFESIVRNNHDFGEMPPADIQALIDDLLKEAKRLAGRNFRATNIQMNFLYEELNIKEEMMAMRRAGERPINIVRTLGEKLGRHPKLRSLPENLRAEYVADIIRFANGDVERELREKETARSVRKELIEDDRLNLDDLIILGMKEGMEKDAIRSNVLALLRQHKAVQEHGFLAGQDEDIKEAIYEKMFDDAWEMAQGYRNTDLQIELMGDELEIARQIRNMRRIAKSDEQIEAALIKLVGSHSKIAALPDEKRLEAIRSIIMAADEKEWLKKAEAEFARRALTIRVPAEMWQGLKTSALGKWFGRTRPGKFLGKTSNVLFNNRVSRALLPPLTDPSVANRSASGLLLKQPDVGVPEKIVGGALKVLEAPFQALRYAGRAAKWAWGDNEHDLRRKASMAAMAIVGSQVAMIGARTTAIGVKRTAKLAGGIVKTLGRGAIVTGESFGSTYWNILKGIGGAYRGVGEIINGSKSIPGALFKGAISGAAVTLGSTVGLVVGSPLSLLRGGKETAKVVGEEVGELGEQLDGIAEDAMWIIKFGILERAFFPSEEDAKKGVFERIFRLKLTDLNHLRLAVKSAGLGDKFIALQEANPGVKNLQENIMALIASLDESEWVDLQGAVTDLTGQEHLFKWILGVHTLLKEEGQTGDRIKKALSMAFKGGASTTAAQMLRVLNNQPEPKKKKTKKKKTKKKKKAA